MLDTTCNLENFEFVDFGIYYGVGMLLVYKFSPLESNTENEDISSTREGKIL
jgi:hypothetical protein